LKHHILIIGAVWVEPNSSAAGSRMLQLIMRFLQENWTVTFASTVTRNKNSLDLSAYGIEEVAIKLNDTSFDEFIENLKPTIVVFDRFMTEEQFGWRVTKKCPNALKILDTEDLHSLRKIRQEAVKRGEEFEIDSLLNSDVAKREIASILRCDMSLIISSFEMYLLKEVFKIDEQILYHLPFMMGSVKEETKKTWKTYEERKHFVFIGNFMHAPNVDAVLFLKNTIWKEIKKELPSTELHIYGAYPTQQILQLNNPKEGFVVKGFVEDAVSIFQKAKVLLAPLRFGAGIKGKLIDAMLNGTPSVTSAIGAEGMCDDLDWNGFIEDVPTEFAKKAMLLYQEEDVWKQAQKNGVEIINSLYEKDELGNAFVERITSIQSNLNTHRTKNFIGSMLQHHSLQSTKYMSKWIEEKQRHQSSGGS
jgi:glycosyltransferase involved in cell wall biosynthesis